MRKEGKIPQRSGNWKRAGTGILIQKGGKNYMVNPKKPGQVYEVVRRFPNTEREYYEVKSIVDIDLTKELEEWKTKFSKS